MEKYISYLGHELQVKDIVKFQTGKMLLIGRVTGFENGKVMVMTSGVQYKTGEELEYARLHAKRSYKVNPKRCIKCVRKVA